MKKYFLLLFFLNLNSLVKKIDSFFELKKHSITKDSLIVLDIGSTLVYEEPLKELDDILEKNNINNFDSEWLNIRPTDPDSLDYLKELIKNYKVIVLSRNKDGENFYRFYQMKQLGLDFSNVYPNIPYQIISEKEPATFDKGLIVLGKKDRVGNKGKVLEKFLNKNNINPDKIIFIDDKMENINSVKKVAQNKSIPYIGFQFLKST